MRYLHPVAEVTGNARKRSSWAPTHCLRAFLGHTEP